MVFSYAYLIFKLLNDRLGVLSYELIFIFGKTEFAFDFLETVNPGILLPRVLLPTYLPLCLFPLQNEKR